MGGVPAKNIPDKESTIEVLGSAEKLTRGFQSLIIP